MLSLSSPWKSRALVSLIFWNRRVSNFLKFGGINHAVLQPCCPLRTFFLCWTRGRCELQRPSHHASNLSSYLLRRERRGGKSLRFRRFKRRRLTQAFLSQPTSDLGVGAAIRTQTDDECWQFPECRPSHDLDPAFCDYGIRLAPNTRIGALRSRVALL